MDTPINYFVNLSQAMISIDELEIDNAIHILKQAREKKASVYIFGNGGSASTASHFANDLTKIAGIKAFSLPAMVPTMTAYGNDDGWENMFLHILDAIQEPDDVLVAISCSGKSINVVQAAKGIDNLIVLTGNNVSENPLAQLRPKSLIIAPHPWITIQEDIHLAVCHSIAMALRE